MAREVTYKLVVVCGEVADHGISLGGGVQHRGRVMGEAGKVGAIFFREECFDMLALFAAVYLEGFIIAGGEEKFTRVVKVKGGGRRVWFLRAEYLCRRISVRLFFLRRTRHSVFYVPLSGDTSRLPPISLQLVLGRHLVAGPATPSPRDPLGRYLTPRPSNMLRFGIDRRYPLRLTD